MKKLLKRTLCILLAMSVILCFSACKGNSEGTENTGEAMSSQEEEVTSDNTSGGNESTSQSTQSQGNNQSVNSTTSSSTQQSSSSSTSSTPSKELKEFEKTYRPATVQRISEIRAAKSDIKPQGSGKAYYVSNSGKASNTGLSPSSPLATYAQVKAKGLKSGDVIYFKRGDLWREQIEVTTPGITLTAYGDGAAPKFYGSPENSGKSGYWIETDVKNVYEYKNSLTELDVGSIIFDDKEYTYKSCYSSTDQSNSKSQRYVNSYKNLKNDLQMYHDPSSKKLYLCSTKGNPANRFSSIELVYKVTMYVKADNVTIDGLCMKYACFGISSFNSSTGLVKGLTVRNCEFGWIGGNVSNPISSTSRFGNGIEIWGAAENFTVTNNYFWQIYDAGVTFQYDGKVFNDVKNVKFNNNVFEYCNYSVEYFFRSNGGKVYDFEIKNNHFWYAGEGLCNQRPDHAEVSHIRSGWATQGNAIKIENNLFAISLKSLARTLDYSDIGGAYNNNTYIQYARREFAYNGKSSTPFKADANVKSNIVSKLGDKNAKVVIVEN